MRRRLQLLTATLGIALMACDDASDGADPGDVADVSDAMGDTAADDADVTEDSTPTPACWTDLEVGAFEVFYDGFEDGSEGVAFGADGRLYVTAADAVWAFDAEGNRSKFADVPTALGLAPTTDGFIVASIGESLRPQDLDGAVYHVSESGEATLIADGIASPNFVAMMPDGSALVSDDFDTRVWRVTRSGDVEVAVEEIASPNGMGYLPDGSALVIASTFSPDGEITAVPVDADGLPQASDWERLAELGSGATADGLAVSADGAVYVAANLRNQLVRIPPGGGEAEVVATGLGTPASLAFGAGEGFDPCSVYVTQLLSTSVLRVALGVPGAPLVPERFGPVEQ